jgi:hypothetical protein
VLVTGAASWIANQADFIAARILPHDVENRIPPLFDLLRAAPDWIWTIGLPLLFVLAVLESAYRIISEHVTEVEIEEDDQHAGCLRLTNRGLPARFKARIFLGEDSPFSSIPNGYHNLMFAKNDMREPSWPLAKDEHVSIPIMRKLQTSGPYVASLEIRSRAKLVLEKEDQEATFNMKVEILSKRLFKPETKLLNVFFRKDRLQLRLID